MPDNMYILIVASQSSPEKEDEYNRWYTEVHLPLLFGYRGVKKASRYRRTGDDDKSGKYLAIYEFESEEALEAFPESPEFKAAIQDFENMKEEVGFDPKWSTSYELIKSWER